MPHLREPLDAFTDPEVEEIVLMTGAQIGKSRLLEIFAAYTICERPTHIIQVLPRQQDIKNVAKMRIDQIIECCPRVSDEVTDSAHDLAIGMMKFRRCCWIWASAGSRSDMSQWSCGVALADEVGDYKANLRKEGSPLFVMRQRTNSYPGRRKIAFASTPNTSSSGIYPEYAKTDQSEFCIPCPHCRHYQPLRWAQVKWPKDVPIEKVVKDQLAYYECEACEGRWTDVQKREQAQLGVWRPKGAEVDKKGRVTGGVPSTSRGFHMPGLLSTLRPFSDFVARWNKCETRHDQAAFFRLEIGEPWEERIEEYEASDLAQNVLPGHRLRSVPSGVELLVAGADVGKRAVHWTVWGFARGMTAWAVDRGIAATVNELDQVLEAEYAGQSVRLMFVDTGWDEETKSAHSSQHKVMEFVHANRNRVHACVGRRTLANDEQIQTRGKDKIRGRTIQGQFKWHAVNTTYFKDEIAEHRTREQGETGAFYLPEDCGEDFLEQLSAESKVVDDDGKTFWQQTGGPNHYGDATVYAFAAAWYLGLWKGSARKPKQQHVAKPSRMRPQNDDAPADFPFPGRIKRSWIGGRRRK